jgi:hypothetical protein
MFTPLLRQRARATRPAGAASVTGATLWRRYPKRDSKGNIEWIHWADLDLAAAWAEQALRDLDAFVVKYSGPTASAAQLEGGARAPITAEAFGVLRSLNNAFQALNVPPIVTPESDELGTVDLIRSYVVLTGGRVEVRTQLLLSSRRRGPSPVDEMAALWRTLGARELANDDGLVVDVRARRTAFRGPFEATLAFKQNAAVGDRAFLALWARRPWTLVRAEGESELLWSAPLVWDRDRVVHTLELARPLMAAIARDPWSALVSARERVKANNDALAVDWAGQLPTIANSNTAREVERLKASMEALAQARSEAALNHARAAAREGLATGAGTVAGVLGILSAAAPPAALVLAPAAAVLGALAALAGLLLQVIPRDWLATAEVLPPRLPLPYMITGDEGPSSSPTHSVPRPTSAHSASRPAISGPAPLDAPPVDTVFTMMSSVATEAASTSVRRPPRIQSTAVDALLTNSTGGQQPSSASDEEQRASTEPQPALHEQRQNDRAAIEPRARSSGAAIAVASLGASAALLWLLSKRR